MSYFPISDSLFVDGNSKINLDLTISPNERVELACSIKHVRESWKIKAHIVYTVSQETAPPKRFVFNLGSSHLEPMETRTIGAWKDVFLRESGTQWNLPTLTLQEPAGAPSQIDPIEVFGRYANQDLLEITAYENGVSLKSEYLTLKA